METRTDVELGAAYRKNDAPSIRNDFQNNVFYGDVINQIITQTLEVREETLQTLVSQITERLASRIQPSNTIVATVESIFAAQADCALDLPTSAQEIRDKITEVVRCIDRVDRERFIASFREAPFEIRFAEQFLRDVLSKKRLSAPDSAECSYALGLVYEVKFELRDALDAFVQAAEIQQSSCKYLRAASGMALSCGVPADAETYSRRWLHLSQDAMKHDEQVRARCSLGSALHQQHLHSDAIAAFEDALQLADTHPVDHTLRSLVLNNLGGSYTAAKSFDLAEQVLSQALDLRRHNRESAKNIVVTMNNLAEVFRATGRLAEAEGLLIGAQKKIKRNYQGNTGLNTEGSMPHRVPPPVLAQTLNNLGCLYLREFDDPEKALLSFEEALSALGSLLEDWMPNVWTTLHNLGLAHVECGNVAQAREFFRRSWNGARTLFGPTDARVLMIEADIRAIFGDRFDAIH